MASPADVPGPALLARGLLRLAGEAAAPYGGRARGPDRRDQGRPRARYSNPRIHAELVARGEPCRVITVARLMRREGIAARTMRKFRCTTDSKHDRPVDANGLDRQFEPEAPNRAWTANITNVATGEGWLYLAALEDLHSLRIIGCTMSERIDSRLVVDALEMAITGRLPGEGLVARSDWGSLYASEPC